MNPNGPSHWAPGHRLGNVGAGGTNGYFEHVESQPGITDVQLESSMHVVTETAKQLLEDFVNPVGDEPPRPHFTYTMDDIIVLGTDWWPGTRDFRVKAAFAHEYRQDRPPELTIFWFRCTEA